VHLGVCTGGCGRTDSLACFASSRAYYPCAPDSVITDTDLTVRLKVTCTIIALQAFYMQFREPAHSESSSYMHESAYTHLLDHKAAHLWQTHTQSEVTSFEPVGHVHCCVLTRLRAWWCHGGAMIVCG
jgi:hypothetical protein